MRKRERLTLEVTGLDEAGAGVGDAAEARVHVAGALPTERVAAEVEHRSPHKREAWARLVTVERAAAERVQPACAAYGECGGCPLGHFAYAAQLAWKGARVAELLAPLGVEVSPCVPSPRPLGYRNRSKLVYGFLDGRAVLGAYAPRSHRLVDLAGCRVAEPPLDDTARALAALFGERRVAPYDEQSHEGLLRYAILRVNFSGEVLATLVTAGDEWPDGAALARALRAARPELAGVVQNINPTRGNRIYGDRDVPLDGRATLDEKVGAVKLRLSPTAFFQVNRELAARLYADVLAAAKLDGSERVVDVYSGVGGVALTLAPHAREVIGVEEVAPAVADAEAGAQLNGATNARFVCADAAAGLRAIDRAEIVVLNPPRRGCDPAVLDEAARLGPRAILYVSCAPETLARDLAQLTAKNFRIRSITPYDMLPETPHVEALAVLEK